MDLIIKEINVKSILTKSDIPVGDYSVNPYIGCTHGCKYCYASFMKRFTNHLEPWGEFLDVKYWQDIKNTKKYAGKEMFLGSVTDPYNPQEEKYKRTRTFLEQMVGSGIKLAIQTKSDLVLRDIDLIKKFPNARVGFSINTLDEKFKDDMDKSVSIKRKIAAMEILHSEGIRTTCFISPIFPGITNVEKIIEKVQCICNLIWLENLNLRGNYKKVILDYIKEKYIELLPLYEEIYQNGSRLYWEQLDINLKKYAEKSGFKYLRNDDSAKQNFNELPIIVNYFYHDEVKKSANKRNKQDKQSHMFEMNFM